MIRVTRSCPRRFRCTVHALGAFWLVSGVLAPARSAAAPVPDSALETVARRLHAEVLTQGDPSAQTVERLLASQRPDGSWPDVDYASQLRAPWATLAHLRNVLDLARRHARDVTPDPRLLPAITRGLDYWTANDFQNPNWFNNDIATPRLLADILVLVGDRLAPPLQAGCVRITRRAGLERTGANLVSEAGILVSLGVATRDRKLVTDALAAVTREMILTTAEGVQHDHSFHQHGAMLNSGNYGLAMLGTASRLAALFAGTDLALRREVLDVPVRHITEYQAWTIWKARMDLMACGRQLDYPGAQSEKARRLSAFAVTFADADPVNADALRRTASDREGPDIDSPVGNRHFWRSDYSVHRTPTWYASFKAHSRRVLPIETSANAENLKGYHLNDGSVWVMVTGREYDDIQPAWDWRRLPGVTWKIDPAPIPSFYPPRLTDEQAARWTVRTDFVGGVSDATRGLSSLDFAKEDVRARKSVAFARRGLLCLGAGIRNAAGAPMYTTVDQRLLGDSPPWVLRAGRWTRLDPSDTTHAFDDVAAVWHADTAFLFTPGTRVTLRAGPQSGRWRDLKANGSSDALQTRDVLLLSIDHGPTPVDAVYAYAVIPAIDRDAFTASTSMPAHGWPARILANTPALQASHDPDDQTTFAAFHTPGQLDVPDLGTVAVSDPCLVLVRREPARLTLTLSDPTQRLAHVRLTLPGRWSATAPDITTTRTGTTTLLLPLPQGPHAGRSTTFTLTP